MQPPLCDYRQWIDTELAEDAKKYIEDYTAYRKWRWERREEKKMKREKLRLLEEAEKEELRLEAEKREDKRRAEALKAVVEARNRGEERERKREIARRNKMAFEAGTSSDAMKKGKWPRRTE